VDEAVPSVVEEDGAEEVDLYLAVAADERPEGGVYVNRIIHCIPNFALRDDPSW